MKVARRGIHFASLSQSPRLQALLGHLRACGKAGSTTRDIIRATGICAVNSAVDELRCNGFRVPCWFQGVNSRGNHIYRYILKK